LRKFFGARLCRKPATNCGTPLLPAHLAGRFRDPVRFVQTITGDYLVLDRRAHTVSRIDREMTTVSQVIDIGFEEGRVLSPTALSVGPAGAFAVADAPKMHERIQFFTARGSAMGSFFLDSRVAARLTIGSVVLNGVGSMQFTDDGFLINRPESGGLITELNLDGHAVRHLGLLRRTGYESDPALHLAFNAGLPLVDPTGGYYFVFQSGVPMFRKYDAEGTLLFERHIEGVELDRQIQGLPTTWPVRETATGAYPLVTPLVRTAEVDRKGRLWVSLVGPFSYVYDPAGEKLATIQFEAAGAVAPTSFFFTADNRLLVTPGLYVFDVQPLPFETLPGSVSFETLPGSVSTGLSSSEPGSR